jgi:hypothetical protein
VDWKGEGGAFYKAIRRRTIKNSTSQANRERYSMAKQQHTFSFPIWEVTPFSAVPSIRQRRIPAIIPVPMQSGFRLDSYREIYNGFYHGKKSSVKQARVKDPDISSNIRLIYCSADRKNGCRIGVFLR